MSFAVTRSRAFPTSAAMRPKLWTCLLLACAAVPPAAPRMKLAGRVADAASLKAVRTYCIDTRSLTGTFYSLDWPPERFDLSGMIERETGPKGLLSRLPWKLEPDCSAPGAGAVMWFEFPPTAARGWEARLLIAEKASRRVIYTVEGNSLGYHLFGTGNDGDVRTELHCWNAVYNALWALVSDIKAVSKKPKKP